MKTTGTRMALAALAGVLASPTGAALAQEGAFGGAPTGVPMPSPGDITMGPTKKAERRSDRCNLFIKSKLESEIVHLHHTMNHCHLYSRSKYDEYTDNSIRKTMTLDQKNDPLNYFRFHGMDTAPYEEAAVWLGYVNGSLPASAGLSVPTTSASPSIRRLSEAEVAAVMAEAEAAGRAAGEWRPAASEFADGGAPGACGIPYLDQDAKSYQAFIASEGECAEYVAEVEAEGY